MNSEDSPVETIVDYITGEAIPNVGAEYNRQLVEQMLVEVKGYAKSEIGVNVPIVLEMKDETYRSHLDLVVSFEGIRCMVIKCAAGSLGSREREVIAAARLLEAYQIPLAVASDGHNALVWDTVSGGLVGKGLEYLPDKRQTQKSFDAASLVTLAPERRLRQQLIFRSYDSMNINTARRAFRTG